MTERSLGDEDRLAPWEAEGRVFSHWVAGRRVWPAYQFDAYGEPRPIVARVLIERRQVDLTDHQVALWFEHPNGWLDGASPCELLGTDDEE